MTWSVVGVSRLFLCSFWGGFFDPEWLHVLCQIVLGGCLLAHIYRNYRNILSQAQHKLHTTAAALFRPALLSFHLIPSLQGQPSSGIMKTARQLWPARSEDLHWLFRQMTSICCLKHIKGFNVASRLLFPGCQEGFEHSTVVHSPPKGLPHRASHHRSCYCGLRADKTTLKQRLRRLRRRKQVRQVELRRLKDRMNEVMAKRRKQKWCLGLRRCSLFYNLLTPVLCSKRY